MPKEPQDRWIRSKLEEFQLPLQEGDWEVFLSDHLAPASSAQALDQLILDSLVSLEMEPQHADWAAFESMLPVEAPIVALHDHPFSPEPLPEIMWVDQEDLASDQLIREKLAAFEMPFSSADWASLAASLDGNTFDQAIREKLEGVTIPFQSQDWREMSIQLDGPMYAGIRAQLSQHEIAYSSSDWRLFARTWLGDRPWYVEWRNLASIAAILLLLISVLAPFAGEDRLATPRKWISKLVPSYSPGFEVASIQQPPSFQEPILAKGSPDDPELELTLSKADTLQGNGQPRVALDYLLASQALINHSDPVAQEAMDSDQLPAAPVLININRIDPVKHRKIVWQDLAFPRQAPVWTNWLPKTNQLYSFLIGAYGSWGRTRAELSSLTATPGFSAGIRAELGINEQVSLITGFLYEERGFSQRFYSFSPSQQSLVNLVDADLQLAEIPLLVRYYLPTAPKVRLYGQTGIITMVSLKEEYQLFQKREDFVPTPSLDGGNLRLENPAGGQVRSLETYIGNVYGGFGVDVEFAKRWHAQVEPYTMITLQKTKGSGALGIEKQMFHAGIGFSLLYNIK
ncbi:MAG: PorT family protein [Bacteroidia bacterium]|nr:PorT family protein [Bacteroidia bacterium]